MRTFESVTLAAATTSSTIDCTDGQTFVGIQTPASMASTALTFQGSVNGSNFVTVMDVGGGSYSVTVAASRYIPVKKELFDGLPYVRLVFGNSETATFLVAKRP